ncbi:MAG: CTP synthase [Geodermatophilaceae bacterium]|nr:CTP synthase [Geodermatophilaceae bacterium]
MEVLVIGDFDRGFAPHVATNAAIEHSAAALGLDVEVGWRATEPLDKDLGDVTEADALWCAPGSACRSLTGAVAALRFGRENGVPTLGTCGGCQHIIIEFARNVLGFSDAQHAEYDPYASRLFISSLACSLAGRTMAVNLTSGSRVAEMYAGARTEEQYYCNFGLNDDYRTPLENAGLLVTGVDDDGEARVLELSEHRFYVATLFVPQNRSTADEPHP